MELSISVLLDELTKYKAIPYKVVSNKIEFMHIQLLNDKLSTTDPSYLYLVEKNTQSKDFGYNYPRHLIILGDEVPEYYEQNADTIIQITEKISLYELLQLMMDIFNSYENWNQAMLMAIIEHKNIDEFLNLAAKKLTNPIALLDNGLTLIAKAGEFKKSYSKTIWDKIENLGYAPSDFFTLQEQQEYSNIAMTNKDKPYIYSPIMDDTHTYVTSHIWINDKLYGNLGSVSINSPFTEGQLSLVEHITKMLKYYYINNDIYMGIAENNTNFINHLLEDVSISEDIIYYHLNKNHWNRNDDYYCLYFICPIPLRSPIESMSFVKRINQCLPKSLISLHKDSIIAILRHRDYTFFKNDELDELEQFLLKKEMKCGISSCFHDFMQLKYYFIQCRFAAEYCNKKADTSIQLYEDCHKEHIIQLLDSAIDIKCLCHPQILSMWNSQEENNHELIHCLYYYLLNGKNLSLTSKTLHLHRNTLIYRINKVSDILDIDFKNLSVEKMHYFLFSCMLVQNIS